MDTEHSEAFQNNCVINLCRICSKREKLSSEKRPAIYLCKKIEDEILVVFGVNISTDETPSTVVHTLPSENNKQ